MDYAVIGDNTLVKCSPTVDVNLNAQIDKHLHVCDSASSFIYLLVFNIALLLNH